MSDTPEARPGAPRPPTKPLAPGSSPSVVARPGKPVPPAAPTPRKPVASVTDAEELQLASSSLMPIAAEAKPPPPVPTARRSSSDLANPIPPRAPSSNELVTSAAPMPAVSKAPAAPAKPSIVAAPAPVPAPVPAPTPTPSPAPAVVNPREAETPVAPAVVESKPEVASASSGSTGLSDAMQEQLTAILRTVLESTLAPAIEKQRELEARIEVLQARKSVPHSSSRTPITSLAPVRASAASIDITGSFNSSAPARMVNTSYGLVSVMPGPAPRPAIEEALERVGPIDMPDFAGKRKFAGAIVIGILILAVVGAIVATILSYS